MTKFTFDTHIKIHLHWKDKGDYMKGYLSSGKVSKAKYVSIKSLRYYDEMKYSEMSKLLNTSEGALKASYHIAVKKITDFFNKQN